LTPAEEKEGNDGLLEEEANLPISDKKCVGDASETGLIKFCDTLLPLEATRAKFPTFSYTSTVDDKLSECFIPFNSEIKFNLYIRDMNKAEKHPKTKEDNLMLIMKGAPERILKRCGKILINGEEREFDQYWQAQVKKANDKFGKMGERVLAFARIQLDPKIYTKEPAYEFDVKNWKKWMDVTDRDENIKGWFPMHKLTLVGIVSLNDPPRPSVPYSVKICRQAGIKVVMVTGDQPPTAASIAHKVNIITDPTLEYNTMVAKGMSEDEAWSKSKALVIHGDFLAEKHAE
jgi:sodium/potassium-transporting ATPase subunit alpha